MKLKTFTFTTDTALAVLNGLAAISAGYSRTIKDGERETVVQMPFKIETETKKKIWKNIDRLKPEVELYQRATVEKAREKSKNGTGNFDPNKDPSDGPRYTEYQLEDRKLRDAPIDIDLYPIEESRLDDVVDRVIGPAMSLIAPILVEKEE